MSWPHRVVLIVPAHLKNTANQIAAALDPDLGGNKTFSIPLPDVSAPTHWGAYTAAAESFVQTIQAVMSGQVSLVDAVAADYAQRWPDVIPPTAEQCAAFIDQARVRVNVPWNDVLVELDLLPDDTKESGQ